MKLTRITSDSGRLTKEIGLTPDGKLAKKGATFLTKGKAERINVANFAELATLIKSLESNQAVIHADYRHESDSVQIVAASALNGSGDKIARTKEHFFFRADDGTISFDYDGGSPLSADDWLSEMLGLWAGFDGAGYVHT